MSECGEHLQHFCSGLVNNLQSVGDLYEVDKQYELVIFLLKLLENYVYFELPFLLVYYILLLTVGVLANELQNVLGVHDFQDAHLDEVPQVLTLLH